MHLELVDIGSNLTHDSFEADRDEVIAAAARAGITRQVVTGADVPGSRKAAELAAGNPGRLWSTAGIHPHHASGFETAHRDQLTDLLALPQVVAVGECGLDYHRDFSPRDAQRTAFVAQLRIAADVRKPVFLHQRDSHEDFVAILREFRAQLVGGVAHCFTGDSSQLEDYLDLGLYVGITGWVCDERRGLALREAVPRIPRDRLMLETDAPYLLPRDLQPRPKSRRNEPMHLVHVARSVAALRGEPFADLAAYSTRNAVAFFGLSGIA